MSAPLRRRVERAAGCRWCRVAENGGSTVFEGPSFVVVGGDFARCARGSLTLVPRKHISVITDAGVEDLAAILAALRRLTSSVERVMPGATPTYRAHPLRPTSSVHLHFHADAPGGDAGVRALSQRQSRLIIEAMSS